MNAQAHDGRTPLHVLFDQDVWERAFLDPEPARLLVTNGADLALRDAAGRTPLEVAMQAGYAADFLDGP